MDYRDAAKSIVDAVGGVGNISEVVHCATRLRFNLVDDDKADVKKIEGIDGVRGTMRQGGQFQVIIGNEVTDVYDEVIGITGAERKPEVAADEGAEAKKGGWGSRLISTLTEIFAPALPAITGAGMFKALLAAVVAFNLLDTTGATYRILYAMGDAIFYFLPMIIGFTSAKKFGGNPALVLGLAGLLLYPDFMTMLSGEDPVSFFMLPVTKFTYSASVIPIILIALIEAPIEKWMYRHVWAPIRYFIAPLLTLFICGVIGILVLGPLGAWVGDIIAIGLQWLVTNARIFGCILIGVLGPFIGMTGIHQSFTPITISMFTQFGYDPLMFPATLACNMGQCGVALAVGLRVKDTNKRSQLLSSSLTALMGITEPALFGCTIKSKKTFAAAMIGGGIGALVAGLLSLKAFAISGPGLASIAMFLGGTDPVGNIVAAAIVMVVSIVASFIAAWFIGGKSIAEEM
ncbi:PTS transporter subunit EIIC [Collinsella sp. An2]|uniref:PTS transporter subunit EIIC n=1 Tax=Collinsella sp. An2 TaxID=1965585 RepID=UPI001302563B|nr:PTS transporter subunit EIIC [Collinsella sp. An2]